MTAGCAGVALIALATSTTGDYSLAGVVSGDNAGPALRALAHADVSGFLSHQPLMGLFSLLVRLPLVTAATHAHAGELTIYRFGAFACLLPAGLFAGWMVQRSRETPRSTVAAVLAACVVIAGPATAEALSLGHPEEVLASSLATGAVLAAVAGRPRFAALMLGAAIGTKQWALLAAIPVLMAVRSERRTVVALAGAVGLSLAGLAPLGDPASFGRASSTVFGGHLADPFSVWWPLGSSIPAPVSGGAAPIAHHLPLGLTRSTASAVALALGIAAVGGVGLRRRRVPDPLALLALLGLLRCIADPTPLEYNFVDVLIPLAAWEVVGLRRLPLVTLCTAGSVWLLTERLVGSAPALLSAMSLIGAAVLASHLARRPAGVAHDGPARLSFSGHEPITGS